MKTKFGNKYKPKGRVISSPIFIGGIMIIKTKYGEINVSEDELGAITVRFDTMDDVMVELIGSNSLKFHIIKPRTNQIRTKLDLTKNK